MVSIYASVLGQRFVCHIGWMPGWSSTTLVFAIHHICVLHGTGFWLHCIAFYQLWLWPTPNVAQKWWQQHENDDVKDNKKIWSYWWWTSTIRLAISHRSRIGTDVLRAFKWQYAMDKAINEGWERQHEQGFMWVVFDVLALNNQKKQCASRIQYQVREINGVTFVLQVSEFLLFGVTHWHIGGAAKLAIQR